MITNLSKIKRTVRANKIYKNTDIEDSRKYIVKKNEIITNRLLILFGMAVILVASMVYFMNMPSNETSRLRSITFVCMFVFGLMLVLSLIFLIYRYTKGIDEGDKTIHSKNIFGVTLFLFLTNQLIFFTYQRWIPFLTALLISITVLVYIYYLYQREFFIFSVFAAIGCFLIYFGERQGIPGYLSVFSNILLVLLSVVVFVSAFIVNKNKGYLFKINILDKKAKYFQFHILAVLLAASAALAVQNFFNINFLYIIIFITAYFVIIGIYFTFRMIK